MAAPGQQLIDPDWLMASSAWPAVEGRSQYGPRPGPRAWLTPGWRESRADASRPGLAVVSLGLLVPHPDPGWSPDRLSRIQCPGPPTPPRPSSRHRGPSLPRPWVLHRDPKTDQQRGSTPRGCPGGSEGGGEEAPLSRGNGVRDPETGGGQARMRLEPGALGTQCPEQAQGDPQGQEQSLAPLGLHPVGTLDPHSPPVEGHQQGAPVTGSVPAPASGHKQGCWHPGRGAARDVPLSPGPTCREDSQEVCGLGASRHSPHLPTCLSPSSLGRGGWGLG